MILPVKLRDGYLAYREEIDAAVQRVLESGWYIGGDEIVALETEFAEYVGIRYAISCGSGTDALHLALRSCGIGPGEFVFTVSHTAVATVAAIELAGAIPVMVDIDPVTYTMSPEALEQAVRCCKGRAVIPVHLYGHPAAMPAILDIASKHDLMVIEDCSQAHGAMLGDQLVGTFGDMATFSFYPTKNMGAFGDAGALITDKSSLAKRARLTKEYGWEERYLSVIPGMNTRMDSIQASILRVKLKHLDENNGRRRNIAEAYSKAFLDIPHVRVPKVAPNCSHVYHQYVIRHTDRDDLRGYLFNRGVSCQIHYPLPIHLQPAYKGRMLPNTDALTKTEKISREILCLPIDPQLTDAEVREVMTAVKSWRPKKEHHRPEDGVS